MAHRPNPYPGNPDVAQNSRRSMLCPPPSETAFCNRLHRQRFSTCQSSLSSKYDQYPHLPLFIPGCGDNLLFYDLVITIDFEAGDTLLDTARPEDFNICGLIRGQCSQPEDDPPIVRREIT